VKVTLITQVFDPAVADKVAGLIGQAVAPVLVAAKSPEAAIELIVRAALPVFVSVTDFAALVVFSTWLPNARLVGLNPTPGATANPVPLKFTLSTMALFCPPLVTVAVITRVADSAAATEGVNITLTLHVSPAATLGLHASLEIAKSVLAAGETPVVTMLEKVAAFAVLLVTVNCCGFVATPTGCVPKLKGEGATVSVGTSASLAT
jgi:hypothetical protein